MEIEFAKPGAFLALRTRRQRESCEFNTDSCVIGKKRFFIRGCLPMPVPETNTVFAWMLWAEVTSHVFERYQEFRVKDSRSEVALPGALSVEPDPILRGMDRLPILIHFGNEGERPTFILQPSNHWLCREQQNGISLHRVQEVLHAMFPKHF
jgi:hypothetical protein